MATFLDYQFQDMLHESPNSTVQLARDRAGRLVAIKTVRGTANLARRVERLRHEFAVAQRFDHPGVIRVREIIEHADGAGLVMEYGGRAVSRILDDGPMPLAEAVRIGISVAGVLGAVHAAHVIHKDVKPANIVVDSASRAVKLIDFSIATELSGERAPAADVRTLEGTLAYVSPEQTGRMNRLVDFRSDFYSLGITLFELCTGQRPFPMTDPMELVHAHIALRPPTARSVAPAVPVCLSQVIAKLLSKTAEERYQSTTALVRDLEICQTAITEGVEPPDFEAGAHDHPQRLQISQRLYGRDTDVARLMAAFDRVASPEAGRGDTELLLVAGYSGIGKSAIVSEIHRPIVARRGYFIAGKFDQFNRNIPYASMILAFQSLVGQLLTESDAELASWREKLTQALGPNGQIIIDVIPEVELIVGPQEPVAELGLTETRNRFNHTFGNFVRVFASAERPLVLFLDDLQWADSGSLNLISVILGDPDIRHLLLVGAYRDNEVDASHPLMITLRELGDARSRVQTITLTALPTAHVTALIADSLGSTSGAVASLAGLVMEKTRGNPFFVIQLLLDLYHQDLLRFDPEQGDWTWDMEALDAVGITDNVVDLMVSMVEGLAPSTQRGLQLAACIGNQFDLALLARLAAQTPREAADSLWPALEGGLVVPLSDAYKVSRIAGDFDAAGIRYRFLHDRVQQACYVSLSEEERATHHLALARILLAATDEEHLDESIFGIVSHLNLGLSQVEGDEERLQFARLNLRAARRARASTAYAPALACAQSAVQTLPEGAWSHAYPLCLDLHNEVVDLLYLTLDFEAAEAAAERVLANARDVVDTIRVYEIRIQYYVGQGKMLEAIDTVKEVLAVLGVELTNDAPADLDMASLDSLPPMTDARSLAAMRILMSSMPAIYIAATELLPAVSYAMVRLTVAHGVSRTAPYAWSLYALVLTAFFGRFDEGFAFGRLALRELERTEARELESKVYALVYIFVYHWKRHVREALPGLLYGVKSGIDTGDVEYAGYNCVHYATFTMFVGEDLALTDERLSHYVDLSRQLRQDYGYYYIRIWRELALALRQPGHDRRFITGEVFDEHTETEAIGPMMPVHCSLRTARGWLRYLFGDPEGAAESFAAASEVAVSVAGFVTPVLIAFYQSLALLAAAPARDEEGRAAALEQVAANLALLENWSRHQPDNNGHKVSLVRAERCRVQGDTLGAIQHYEAAITGARTSRYLHEEALAFELAAAFYASMGSAENAAHHRAMAYDLYGRWGAEGKRAALAELHPELSRVRHGGSGRPAGGTDTLTVMTTASTAHEPHLDVGSVVKASQALAGEIKQQDLLDKLMRIVVENVGAETGVLLLNHDDELRVEARHVARTGTVEILTGVATDWTQVPQRIVQYVQRTRRSQVVDDATQDPHLSNDPYVAAHRPRSVLCAPIIQTGRLTGVFYFENNLTPGAFTRDRLEILSMLSAQVAISIENARLYNQLEEYNRNLETTVAQRTQELRAANAELQSSIDQIKKMQRQIVVQAKLASLGTLTAGIAHELRNPLNFVNNFSAVQVELAEDLNEILDDLEGGDAEAAEEARELAGDLKDTSKKIMGHGKRAASIIDNMLRHAHGSSSEREQVDINELLRTNVALAYHGARAKRADLVMLVEEDLADGLPPVKMSRSDVGRVIVNIVNNACDATFDRAAAAPVGSYAPTLRVQSRAIDNGVEIRIRDNGTGIPESVLADVFNPFFTTKPPGEGTGLGLSLSHDIIVQGHRGAMVVDSKVGEYTEFVLRLPLG